MNLTLRKDADAIIASSLNAVLPDEAVRRALKAFAPKGGRVLLVAAGKAAWQMAYAAVEALGRVDGGVVVTKYKHVRGEILGVNCYEAGHPVPDENSFAATEKALELVRGLAAPPDIRILFSSYRSQHLSRLFLCPFHSGSRGAFPDKACLLHPDIPHVSSHGLPRQTYGHCQGTDPRLR